MPDSEKQQTDINSLMALAKQAGPALIEDYCIISRSIWPFEQIEKMDLDEYSIRAIYSLPQKLYKYYPDIQKYQEENGTKTAINYSNQALETNEVYLSSPDQYDDVFDSELSVSRNEYEEYRVRQYARWGNCNISDDMSVEDAANTLLKHLYETFQAEGDLEKAFPSDDKNEYVQLQIKKFVSRLKLEIPRTNDAGVAFKNILNQEYDEFVKKNQRLFRVSCFTTSPYSQLMWGKYANEHKGFCLEYTISDDPQYQDLLHNIRPVIYCKKRHPVTKALLDTTENNIDIKALRDIYLNGALRKSIDWAYQDEWRLLYPPDKHTQTGFNMKFYPITKVFLGNRMPSERRKEIISICKDKGIPYTGMIRSLDRYEMQECTTLCETCPRLEQDHT